MTDRTSGDGMDLSERWEDGWWRVIRADGQVNWTDCDPRELLDGAWQDAKVEGPFVLATERGAVDARAVTDAYDLASEWCLRDEATRPCRNCVDHAEALMTGCKESDANHHRGAVAITDEMIERAAREMTTWSGPVPGDVTGFRPYAERLLRAALQQPRGAVSHALDEEDNDG